MWSFYIWCVALLALALTSQGKQKGDSCPRSRNGECNEPIRCSSAQLNALVNGNTDVDQGGCNNGLICCNDKGKNSFFKSFPIIYKVPKKTEVDDLNYGQISKEKCRNYTDWDHFQYGGITVHIPVKKCGIGDELRSGIFTQATFYEFPHMAQLGYRKGRNLTFNCTVSLISETFLLTAAHCITYEDPPVTVRFGTGDEHYRLQIDIKEIFLYSDYNDDFSAKNDIALVKLKHELYFGNSLRPACLMTSTQESDDIHKVLFSGYSETGGENNMDAVYKVTLEHLSKNHCKATFTNTYYDLERNFDDTTMFCAKGGVAFASECPVYYGSPVQLANKDTCTYQLVGIQSFGTDCKYGSGIYTKISEYIPWIESIVWSGQF